MQSSDWPSPAANDGHIWLIIPILKGSYIYRYISINLHIYIYMICWVIYINIIIYNICTNIEAGSCMKVILPVVFIAMVVDGPCHLRIYLFENGDFK